MIARDEEARPPAVRCAECHLEIMTGAGRYNEPDGKRYHPACYDALQPAPVTALLTRMLEEEGRRIAAVVDALLAIREGQGVIAPSSPSPPEPAREPRATPPPHRTDTPAFIRADRRS